MSWTKTEFYAFVNFYHSRVTTGSNYYYRYMFEHMEEWISIQYHYGTSSDHVIFLSNQSHVLKMTSYSSYINQTRWASGFWHCFLSSYTSCQIIDWQNLLFDNSINLFFNTWMVCEMGGKRRSNCCFAGCSYSSEFSLGRSISNNPFLI